MNRVVPAFLAAFVLASGCLETDSRPVLRILDQGSFPQFDAVRVSFESLTGSRLVKIDGGDAGQALQTALLGAGNPPADLLFGVDNALFFTPGIREKNLFVPYESPRLDRIDEAVIDVNVFRVNGELWATPAEHGFISVNFDARLPASQAPATLADLARQPYASDFVTSDPRFSSPGLGFLLATIATFPDGAAYDWRHYWQDLLRNGTLVARDWTEAYVTHYTGGGHWGEKSAQGRRIVVSYTTSPAAEVLFSGEPIEPPGRSLEPAFGVYPQVETFAILRGTPNLELAQRFIDFMLTEEFQQHNAPLNAVYPVVTGVPLPPAFEEHATPPHLLEPARLEPAQLRDNLTRWLREWQALYQAETA